ncbi:hypothetical protein HYFRA_00001780 [Hymenoscyphus fraxineus]|uniref:Tat pathway signal sequence protein n=1 Tax=Hymenoscyphus fraxineus TaxID=746836 RepID=A0A9N9KMG8_9HELO|nr:hypothetical protein HYFRA_00001780 [Hymenoscyphus fraxineus]
MEEREAHYSLLRRRGSSEEKDTSGRPKVAYSTTISTPVLIHLCILLLYCTVTFTIIKIHSSAPRSLPVLPNAINGLTTLYDTRVYNLLNHSKYVGPPSDQSIDESWIELLDPMYIRVQRSELERNGRTSVSLGRNGKEPESFLAWLGVFHELHCVKLLRQWKYKSHYFPNITANEADNLESHTDHCLDRIRAAFMCHPDTSSLVTFNWSNNQQPVVNGTKTLHSCINWKELIESTRTRAVSPQELAILKNPLSEIGDNN